MKKWFHFLFAILFTWGFPAFATIARETMSQELSILETERVALIQTAEEIAGDSQLETDQKILKLEILERKASEIRMRRSKIKSRLAQIHESSISSTKSNSEVAHPPLSPNITRASTFEILLSGIIWIAAFLAILVGVLMVAENQGWISQDTAQGIRNRIQSGVTTIRKTFEPQRLEPIPQRGRISDGEVPRHLA